MYVKGGRVQSLDVRLMSGDYFVSQILSHVLLNNEVFVTFETHYVKEITSTF